MFSYERKLYRALGQLRSLESDMDGWIKAHPLALAQKLNANEGQYVVRVGLIADPPTDFGLMLGDCIHNLRSALDHLVFELVRVNLKGTVPDKVAHDCGFPVYGKKPPSPDELKDRIGSIDPRAQAVIKELQPYLRGKDLYAHEPLWMLHQLDISDKHHAIPLTVVSARQLNYGVIENATIIEQHDFTPCRLKTGTEVMRFRARKIEENAEMKVEYRLAYSISFEEGPPGQGSPVIPTLETFYNYIATQVLGPLVEFLV